MATIRIDMDQWEEVVSRDLPVVIMTSEENPEK